MVQGALKTGLRIVFFIFSEIKVLWRYQSPVLQCNGSVRHCLKLSDGYLTTFAFWKIQSFLALVWKKNNNVPEGNNSHNNVLKRRQCGKCIRCPQNTLYWSFCALKIVCIIIKEEIGFGNLRSKLFWGPVEKFWLFWQLGQLLTAYH